MGKQTYEDFLKELDTLWTDENIMKVLDYMNVDYEYLGNEEDKNMTKIYYGTSIATIGESNDSIRVANNMRNLGYDVYAAAENKEINDKTNNPPPNAIYKGDVPRIIESDIFVVNLTGGTQDGTIAEVGFVTGWNEKCMKDNEPEKCIHMVGFTTNARLLHPQHHKGLPSAGVGHLGIAMIEEFGTFVGGERELYGYLSDYVKK